MKCVYMAIMSLDPTGKGQARWTMRWKATLNPLSGDAVHSPVGHAKRSENASRWALFSLLLPDAVAQLLARVGVLIQESAMWLPCCIPAQLRWAEPVASTL